LIELLIVAATVFSFSMLILMLIIWFKIVPKPAKEIFWAKIRKQPLIFLGHDSGILKVR